MHSFNYLVPALFWNATVYEVINLGNLSTGGVQVLGKVKDATLQSEPGFEPQFKGTMLYGTDYVTLDGNDPAARPHLSGTIFPEDGSSPFLMQVTGVQKANAEVDSITATNTSEGRKVPYGGVYSVWTPTFYGGDEAYANLQNSVFVGSETVSDGEVPGEFLVGIKISKVFPVTTDITIGGEFP